MTNSIAPRADSPACARRVDLGVGLAEFFVPAFADDAIRRAPAPRRPAGSARHPPASLRQLQSPAHAGLAHRAAHAGFGPSLGGIVAGALPLSRFPAIASAGVTQRIVTRFNSTLARCQWINSARAAFISLSLVSLLRSCKYASVVSLRGTAQFVDLPFEPPADEHEQDGGDQEIDPPAVDARTRCRFSQGSAVASAMKPHMPCRAKYQTNIGPTA